MFLTQHTTTSKFNSAPDVLLVLEKFKQFFVNLA